MLPSIVRLLRIASTLICLIVGASFFVFAVNQTKAASGHQQEQVAAISPGTAPTHATRPGSHESSVHKALDETAKVFTDPFAGLVSDSNSEWATRAAELLAALLVYGFGLGYIARALRVRA